MNDPEHMELDQPDRPRLSFREKWELHKPLLERLYLDEKLKLLKIKAMMREQFGFDAEEHQYKYQFKKWGWLKILKAHEKERLLEIAHQRVARGEATAITQRGQVVDSKKLNRHAKTHRNASQMRFLATPESPSLLFSIPLINNTFDLLNWNVPYAHMMQQRSSQIPRSSPRKSPNLHSRRIQTAPRNSGRKSDLFVTGKFDELLKSLNHNETVTFSTWLYQFWTFGFITAKHWGRGPRVWTANTLWNERNSLTRSESHHFTSPLPENSQNRRPRTPNITPLENIPSPSQSCRWSIHIGEECTFSDDGEELSTSQERSFSSDEWPQEWTSRPFERTLQQALESNSFSTVDASDLPVNLGLVSKAITKSPDGVFKEGLGFAIMGRNFDLVTQMLLNAEKTINLQDLYPFHLALSYLDGSKSCCHILRLLVNSGRRFGCSPEVRNPNGYTLLDTLMIAILRNHSTVSPHMVDDMLRATSFPGNEVDICGRWDAESDVYRAFVNSGATSIPSGWKHKFCHTSIQAICHSIYRFSVETPFQRSGLFSKRCFCCGLKLEVSAIHTLVLTSFHLLNSGATDEDNFDMICSLLMLTFSYGSNLMFDTETFFEQSQISEDLLFEKDETENEHCTHERLYPAEFAGRLEDHLEEGLTPTAKGGWQLFCRILELIQGQYTWATTEVPPAGYEHEHDEVISGKVSDDDLLDWIFNTNVPGFALSCNHTDWRSSCFGRNRVLGHIWAACQAELLNYRRVRENDPWISSRISIDDMRETLKCGNERKIPLIGSKMIKGYCQCGSFGAEMVETRRDDACEHYCANMDDWRRSEFFADELIQ